MQAAREDEFVYEWWNEAEAAGYLSWKTPDGSTSTVAIPWNGFPQEVSLIDDGILLLFSDMNLELWDIQWWERGSEEPYSLALRLGSDGRALEFFNEVYEIGLAESRVLALGDFDGRSCLLEGSLPSGGDTIDLDILSCGDPDERFWWLHTAYDGTASFVAFPDMDNPCGRLLRVLPGTSEVEEVANTGCVSRGESSAEIAVWNPADATNDPGGIDYDDQPGYALHDGEVVGLGSTSSGSLRVCESGVYWTRGITAEGPEQIRRWTPDGPIEVLLDQGDTPYSQDAMSLSSPVCVESTVGVNSIIDVDKNNIVFFVAVS